MYSGGRKLENKKDLRVTQEARRQLELLDFRDSFTLTTSSSLSSSSSPCAFQSACFKSCFLFIHELRDAHPAASKADTLHKIYQRRNFPSATAEIRCYPGLGAGRINGSIDSRSQLGVARDAQSMRNF